MKKVLKITESQYKSLLLSEQGDTKFDIQQNQKNRESLKNNKGGFKMDYKKLKNNPTPEYIANVLKNSEGFFGDNEAWAQSAFQAIKNQETYNEVSSLLGDYAYNFVKGFMDTNIDYHKNGTSIDKEYKRISPPSYHFMCNYGHTRKPKNNEDIRLTIESHSENCHSCTTELRQYCRKNNMVATLVTKKGKYWDDYWLRTDHRENPMNGGHWDNEEYTYCTCVSGEEKVVGNNVYFIDQEPVFKQGPSTNIDKKVLEKQFIKHRLEMEKMNDSTLTLFETLDCSVYRKVGDQKSLWKYQQCVTDNLSMAVSVIPVIGTAASTILDFANGISFLASALWGKEGEGAENLTMAGISFLSMIPGFGEARSLVKMSRKPLIATTDVLKGLEKKQFVSMARGGRYDSALSTLENVEKSNKYNLSKYGRKEVNSVINNLKKIGDKDFEKYFEDFYDIINVYEKGGLKRETLNKLMKKNDFVSLVKKYGDINAAMKSQEFKNMLINVGVQVGFGGGMTYLMNYIQTLIKEIKNRNFDPEKEKFMIEELQSLKKANKELEEYIEKKELNTKENNEKVVDYLEIKYEDPETKYEKEIDLDALFDYVESSEEDIKETLTIDETKHNKKRKIKVSESQFKKLFHLNEQEEDICTPKFKQVKILIKPLVKSYNLSNNEKIVESEYTKNINGETLCRYSFTTKTWDGEELKCIITDNNEYMDSGWILYKLDGKEIASGVYDTSDVKYSYMIFNYKVYGNKQNDGKIFNQFKEILGFYNSESKIQKKINILDKFYTDLKNIDYTKITKNQTNEIYTFLTSNDDCRIYNNSKNVNKLYKKFNTSYLENDDKDTEEESIKIRNILYKKIKNC